MSVHLRRSLSVAGRCAEARTAISSLSQQLSSVGSMLAKLARSTRTGPPSPSHPASIPVSPSVALYHMYLSDQGWLCNTHDTYHTHRQEQSFSKLLRPNLFQSRRAVLGGTLARSNAASQVASTGQTVKRMARRRGICGARTRTCS